MIYCEQGKVKAEGDGLSILAELSALIHDLKFDVLAPRIGEKAAEAVLLNTVQAGLLTLRELEEKNNQLQESEAAKDA